MFPTIPTPAPFPARVPYATVDIAFDLRAERLRSRQAKAAALRHNRNKNSNPDISTPELHSKKRPHSEQDDENTTHKKRRCTGPGRPHSSASGLRKTDPPNERIRRGLLRCRAEHKRPSVGLLRQGSDYGKIVVGGTPPDAVRGELREVHGQMAWASCLLHLRRDELRRNTGRLIWLVTEEMTISNEALESPVAAG